MKITIQYIKHEAFAKRILITYYLSAATQNDAVGWIYNLDYCGYRGVCDDEWILMDPNTQHPLHDKYITGPGTYTFVWDYGGVQGLDPKDFDAEHSYIVQLVLHDGGCDYEDPCEGKYWTPETSQTPGVPPSGEVGSEGDWDNTFNNCGTGYILLEDQEGCLYCDPIIGGDDGNFYVDTDFGGVITLPPWEPPPPGGAVPTEPIPRDDPIPGPTVTVQPGGTPGPAGQGRRDGGGHGRKSEGTRQRPQRRAGGEEKRRRRHRQQGESRHQEPQGVKL